VGQVQSMPRDFSRSGCFPDVNGAGTQFMFRSTVIRRDFVQNRSGWNGSERLEGCGKMSTAWNDKRFVPKGTLGNGGCAHVPGHSELKAFRIDPTTFLERSMFNPRSSTFTKSEFFVVFPTRLMVSKTDKKTTN
jgi:hypothetical protein